MLALTYAPFTVMRSECLGIRVHHNTVMCNWKTLRVAFLLLLFQ